MPPELTCDFPTGKAASFFIFCKELPMEIALSQKTMKRVGLALLLLAAVVVAALTLMRLLAPASASASGPSDLEEPAILALRAIYQPDLGAGQQAWETRVCAGMTEQGCALFRSLYSPAIWAAAQSGANIPGEPVFVEVAEDLGDEGQVWAFTDGAVPVYVHVQRDAQSGRWLLARILFEEEARKRYGGGQ
jgi:hypothetical protein